MKLGLIIGNFVYCVSKVNRLSIYIVIHAELEGLTAVHAVTLLLIHMSR